MNDKLLLEPKAEILIESMRSIGYTFESAMADIIDNSISAEAKIIDIDFNPENQYLTFIDDGYGMNEYEITEAMRWGSKDPLKERSEIDLGRFGLGLKSASLSQCRKLTVVSKVNDQINGLCWDLNVIRETGNWSIIKFSEDYIKKLPFIEKLLKKDTGTYVLWEDFDKVEITSKDLVQTLEELLDFATDYLALIFHIYISKGLTIRINGLELPKIDPFLKKNSFTQPLKAESVSITDTDGNKNSIIPMPYVLPHVSHLSADEKRMLDKHKKFLNKQGFYIYRNDRLIQWGTWFRMATNNEAYKNARVEVHIPNNLDYIWSIDVKKSTATIPSSIKKQLFYAVRNSIETSKKIYKQRAVNVSKQMGYKCIWDTYKDNDKVFYKINRNLPIIENLINTLSDDQIKILDLILEDIETNIPSYSIFNNIANDEEAYTEDYTNVKDRLMSFISSNNITSIDTFDDIIKPLLSSEPYCRYEKLYNEIKKELFDYE